MNDTSAVAGPDEGGGRPPPADDRRRSIEREARVAGLQSFEIPTLEAVERRRLQLWFVTLLLLATVATGIVVAFWLSVRLPAWLSPAVLQSGLLGLVALFCVYAIEKELTLRRLTGLLVEERVLTAALVNRLREVNTLLAASRAINIHLDLDDVLAAILRSAIELLGGHDASVMLAYGGTELRTVATSGNSAARRARVNYGQGIAGQVAQTREPVLINGTVPRDVQAGPEQPESALCVPLLHRGNLLGVLNVNAPATRAYTEHDLRAASVFGEQAATAIVNAQLYESQRLEASQSSFRALHDPLTGLPNRALFLDRVNHALSRRRSSQEPVALLFLDVNRFKTINDTLGHAAGDQALNELARRIRQSTRAGDTLARFGGDEFAVLLEPVPSADEAVLAAQRILAAVAVPFRLGSAELNVSINVGIVLEAEDGATAGELIRNADAALYHAHEDGPGAYAVYAPPMSAQFVRRLDMAQDLERALRAGELTMHYQPIVTLPLGRVAGIEAFARWEHPTRGLLAASAFLPSAAQAGLQSAIDRWALATACRFVSLLHRRGRPELWVSVNVDLAPESRDEPGLVEVVEQVLRGTELRAEQLIIDVTEATLLGHGEEVVRGQLLALRDRGVRIALDDFGSGYGSLHKLRRFPVSVVKVDPLFIDRLLEESDERSFVEALVRFGIGLGMDVVAEGVERPEQAEALRRIGCPYGQGNYFSEPLGELQLLEFLEQRGELVAAAVG